MFILFVACFGLAVWSLARTARLRIELANVWSDVERLTALVEDLRQPSHSAARGRAAIADAPAPAVPQQAPARHGEAAPSKKVPSPTPPTVSPRRTAPQPAAGAVGTVPEVAASPTMPPAVPPAVRLPVPMPTAAAAETRAAVVTPAIARPVESPASAPVAATPVRSAQAAAPAAVFVPAPTPAFPSPSPGTARRVPHEPAATSEAAHAASSLELEERLGTNWLNKIGALMLVMGIAFFLTYQLRTLGPLGKDLIGLGVAAVLLSGGVLAERRTQYRMFSRGAIAAGWGLLFFTTFAMHHVPAARVIDSQAVDLALMLAVAGGMVGHALRYQSEVVTGLAFLFAFGTVAISHDTSFTLTAGAVLALASATIAVRMRWVLVEVGAIAATYINHFLWLPVLQASADDVRPSRFLVSLAILVAYWLTFRVSFCLRRELALEDEQWSSFGAALNAGGLIAVAGQYPLGQVTVFWALLSLGAADLVFGHVVRARRLAFVTLSVMAVALIGAAFPIRFGAHTVSLAWLVEAEALVLIGVRTRESLFTRLGILGSAVAGAHVAAADVWPLVSARTLAAPVSSPAVAFILAVAAAAYYVNCLWVLPRHAETFTRRVEQVLAHNLSFAGAAALAGVAWALVPGTWLATAWLALALALLATARRLDATDIWLQAQGVSVLALARLAAVNVQNESAVGPLDLRVFTLGLAAAGHHVIQRLGRLSRASVSETMSAFHSWVGTTIVVVLAATQFNLWLAVVWMMLALALVMLATRFSRTDLWLQAQTVALIAAGEVVAVNLRDTSMAGPVQQRVIALASVAAGLHLLYRYRNGNRPAAFAALGPVHSWIGTGLLVALAATQFHLWLSVVWAAMAIALVVLATRVARTDLWLQGQATALLAAAQVAAVTFRDHSLLGPLEQRVVVVTLVAATHHLLYRYRHGGRSEALDELGQVHSWIGTTLIAAIAATQFSLWLGAAWMAMAVAVAMLGSRLERQDLWLQAQGLALFAAVQAVAVNLQDSQVSVPLYTGAMAVAAVGAGHHLLYRYRNNGRSDALAPLGVVHSWLGSALLFTLAWYQFAPLAVALVWAGAAVLMLEAGIYFDRRDLRLQALAAIGLSFGRVFDVNLNAGGGLTGPAATATAPLALLFFYVYDRLARRKSAQEWTWTPEVIAAFGSITLGGALRVALTPAMVAPSWGALVLALSIVSVASRRPLFMRQATLGAFAVGAQCIAVNLYGASYFGPWWTTTTMCVGGASALVLAALPLARRLRGTEAATRRPLLQRPDLVMVFVPFTLITWVLARTMTGSFITMSWGIEAVLAFMLALWIRERSVRLAALGLLLACVARIVAIDVWQFDQQGRYLAFIALGSALLIVSFLYSKYRSLLQEYL